eukprot:scaffold286466_cov19-Prasinocladus_malaysianus.AAC.1
MQSSEAPFPNICSLSRGTARTPPARTLLEPVVGTAEFLLRCSICNRTHTFINFISAHVLHFGTVRWELVPFHHEYPYDDCTRTVTH